MSESLAHVARMGLPDVAADRRSGGTEILPRVLPTTWSAGWMEPVAGSRTADRHGLAEDPAPGRLAPTDHGIAARMAAVSPEAAGRHDKRRRADDPAKGEASGARGAATVRPERTGDLMPGAWMTDQAAEVSVQSHAETPATEPARGPEPGTGARDTGRSEIELARVRAVAPATGDGQPAASRALVLSGTARPDARGLVPQDDVPTFARVEPLPVPAALLPSPVIPRQAAEASNVEVRIGRVEIEVRQPRDRRTRAVAPSTASHGRFDGIAAARRLQDRRWY